MSCKKIRKDFSIREKLREISRIILKIQTTITPSIFIEEQKSFFHSIPLWKTFNLQKQMSRKFAVYRKLCLFEVFGRHIMRCQTGKNPPVPAFLFFQINKLVKPFLLQKKSTQISVVLAMKFDRENFFRAHFLGKRKNGCKKNDSK